MPGLVRSREGINGGAQSAVTADCQTLDGWIGASAGGEVYTHTHTPEHILRQPCFCCRRSNFSWLNTRHLVFTFVTWILTFVVVLLLPSAESTSLHLKRWTEARAAEYINQGHEMRWKQVKQFILHQVMPETRVLKGGLKACSDPFADLGFKALRFFNSHSDLVPAKALSIIPRAVTQSRINICTMRTFLS